MLLPLLMTANALDGGDGEKIAWIAGPTDARGRVVAAGIASSGR